MRYALLEAEQLKKVFERLGAGEKDTFLKSVPYFLLTGRKGLKTYSLNDAHLTVLQHPHDENTILVYPELNGNGDLTVKILNQLSSSTTKVRLARYKQDDYQKLAEAIERDRINVIKSINLVPEDIMDWKYPSRIIDTGEVNALNGKAYEKLRNKFNKASSLFEELPLSHPDAIKNIRASIYIWMGLSIKAGNETGHDMTSFYETLVKNIVELPSFFDGFVLTANNEPAGFTIWDKLEGNTANAIAGLSRRSIAGMSEYQTILASKKLSEQGVKYYNLGGSETKALDHFKLKFRPIDSIEINSYEVEYEDLSLDSLVQHTVVSNKGLKH